MKTKKRRNFSPEFKARVALAAVRTSGKDSGILNTDQGCQFNSRAWRDCLEGRGVRLSMDSKGRWVDKSLTTRGRY
jgi:transposase InsO family protein